MCMKKKMVLVVILFILIFLFKTIQFNKKEIIKIDIGYQSVTSQTWGALIIKNKGLFEKRLKEAYPNKKVKVVWHDEISGAVINTSMISGKVQFGFMGDMPLILNVYKSSTLKDYDSKIIAMDGKGINGKNQSILIPKKSKIKSIEELKGKTISTPIGSSAHYMLMKVLEKHNMLDDVNMRGMDSDIYLKNGVYHADIDIPGFNKEDINIEFHKGTITIKAEKEYKDDKENKKYIRHERRYNKLERSFYFSDIDEENIKAESTNGVLHLTIPQKAEVSKKQISIE